MRLVFLEAADAVFVVFVETIGLVCRSELF